LGQSTALLNLIALAVLIPPILRIVPHEMREPEREPMDIWSNPVVPSDATFLPSRPDVYYIILDGYGREDFLRSSYGVDISGFIHELELRGFFVARESRSNYSQTTLTLASALNMQYLDALVQSVGQDSTDHRPLVPLIRQNRVRSLLTQAGYRVVAFTTEYRRTEWRDADVFFSPSVPAATPFEALLLEDSLYSLIPLARQALGMPARYPGYEYHRELILENLSRLQDLGNMGGPKFVFLHLVIPHPPFVFDSAGGPVEPNRPYRTFDGSQFEGSAEEYIAGYRLQLQFLNRELLETIDRLLDVSASPPIIILQGDHGPGAYLDWDGIEGTDLTERFSILSAYYLPHREADGLPPTLSPVNTFRVVFSALTDRTIELLPDRSYFSTWKHPFRLSDVTSVLEGGADG
jgi:hypothetical protein